MKLQVSLSRIHHFCSAHRLHSPELSDLANLEIYEKCNNPEGHGHDYYAEVTITGEPDKDTGMILPLEDMDHKIRSVLDQLDYKHLDREVEFFKTHLSTGEIIIQYLWQELEKHFPDGMLHYLKLWETSNNYFELGRNLQIVKDG